MDMNFLPDLLYDKLQLGNVSRRTRLDEILELIRIPYEEYILYVKAVKVSSSKPAVEKEVYLVLTKNSIVTIRRTGDTLGCVTRYSYVQVESVTKVIQAGKGRPQQALGFFTIALTFYNQDVSAT